MEGRVRQEIATILNTTPNARIVDRLYAVLAREREADRVLYEAYMDAVLEEADAQ